MKPLKNIFGPERITIGALAVFGVVEIAKLGYHFGAWLEICLA